LVWLLDGWAAVLVEGWVPALVFVLVSLGDACVRLFAGGAVLVCAWDDEFGCWADCVCEGAAALLSFRVCGGGEAWFDWACEREESLLPAAGVDWLVVVCDLELAEGDDCVLWVDGVELCDDGVEGDADGADEFELF
jgi:hypothetical protein